MSSSVRKKRLKKVSGKRVISILKRLSGFRVCLLILSFGLLFFTACTKEPELSWKPVRGHLLTRWAEHIDAKNPHPEYPRPQMMRQEWMSLNGLWDYAVRPKGEGRPASFDGKILVPFPIEAALSGVKNPVGEENRLWYRQEFRLPKEWDKKRILLNFEAVDWEVTVWVNGQEVGSHRGGYDPFSFDITRALKDRGKQEIVLAVWDPVDTGYQPRGKQVKTPRGIWYTSVTGIWRTVWLEPVNSAHIESIKVFPDIEAQSVRLAVSGVGELEGLSVEAEVLEGGLPKAKTSAETGRDLRLVLENPVLWSPDEPFLYDLKLRVVDRQGNVIDDVQGYFGMRKISIEKDDKGVNRLMLNNDVLFQFGPLDQGWWPDGLYTAPTDEALRYDLEVTKQLGFNMLRKHVKVEPRRFYYWCDRLGILVWQDMPSGDRFIGREAADIERTEESALQFRKELKRMIDTLFNHPSIIMWVAFNEGWGQFETEGITEWIKTYDAARLVDSASGWADRGVGDVHDIHSYPGPSSPPNEPGRAAVLGEFGGLGLPVRDHTWQEKENWGYRTFQTREELTAAYAELIDKLLPLIEGGLAAAVYTQTTDVEIEVNGLMTYDRAVIKMNPDAVRLVNQKTYLYEKGSR